jgi:hypothetical protein
MSMLWIAVLVVAGPTSELGITAPPGAATEISLDSQARPSANSPRPLRAGRALAKAVHEALVRWAHAGEKDAKDAAREFLVIYKELRADTRLLAPERKELQGKVRGRLARLSQTIAQSLARPVPVATATEQPPLTVGTLGRPAALLERQTPAAGIQWNGPVASVNFAPHVLAQQAPAGGGGVAAPGGGGPNGPDADDGQQLVDVIQTTIAPETWDVNGGQGSIYYWRDRHVLVIRATDDVHGFVSELTDQLERAGN